MNRAATRARSAHISVSSNSVTIFHCSCCIQTHNDEQEQGAATLSTAAATKVP